MLSTFIILYFLIFVQFPSESMFVDWIIGAVVLILILLSVSVRVPKTSDRKCAQ